MALVNQTAESSSDGGKGLGVVVELVCTRKVIPFYSRSRGAISGRDVVYLVSISLLFDIQNSNPFDCHEILCHPRLTVQPY